MRTTVVISLLVALVACRTGEQRPALDCAARAAAFKSYLEDLAQESEPALVPATVLSRLAVVEASGSRPDGAALLVVGPGTLALEGTPVERAALAAALMQFEAENLARAAMMGSAIEVWLLVAIERDTPWAEAAHALHAARGWKARTGLLVQRGAARLKPPSFKIDGQLARFRETNANAGSEAVVREVQAVFGQCPAFLASFQEDPPNLLTHVAARVPATLAACGCAFDDDSARALIFWMMHNPPAGVVALQLDVGGATVARGAGSRWAEAAHDVVTAAQRGPVALHVTP